MEVFKEPKKIMNEAINKFKPDHLFTTFSGGHDSLIESHMMQDHPLVRGCIHIDTGFYIEETKKYVYKIADKYDWNLIEVSPKDAIDEGYQGYTYKEFFYKWGFPGGGMHKMAYQWLKQRPMRMINRWYDGDVMIITGVRAQESDRRFSNVDEYEKRDGVYWVSPIAYFDTSDKNEYMKKHDLLRNPVHDKLHMSGECMCGAMGSRDEREMLKFWGFDILEEIKELERQIDLMNTFRLECMYRPKGQPRPSRWNWKNEKDPEQKDFFLENEENEQDYKTRYLCRDC